MTPPLYGIGSGPPSRGRGIGRSTVRTVQELLAALRTPADRIDLLVLDLRLPNGRGIDLVRSLRRVAPEMPDRHLQRDDRECR